MSTSITPLAKVTALERNDTSVARQAIRRPAPKSRELEPSGRENGLGTRSNRQVARQKQPRQKCVTACRQTKLSEAASSSWIARHHRTLFGRPLLRKRRRQAGMRSGTKILMHENQATGPCQRRDVPTRLGVWNTCLAPNLSCGPGRAGVGIVLATEHARKRKVGGRGWTSSPRETRLVTGATLNAFVCAPTGNCTTDE
jgi:hypothetical protein